VSTLGKIFAFIVLVCAVAFASAAYVLVSETSDFKGKYLTEKADKEKQVASLQADIQKLGADKKQAEEERDKARNEALEQAKTVGVRDAQIASLKEELKKQDGINTALQTDVNKIKDDLNKQLEDNKNLRTQAEAARVAKEDAEAKMRKAQEDLAACQDDLTNTRKRLADTEGTVAKQKELLDRYNKVYGQTGLSEVQKPEVTPVPLIKGEVLKVDNKAGIVLISVGKGDGVASGMTFEVVRSEPKGYVGRIRVTDVYDQEAVCRVVLEVTTKPIKEGDYVATRLQ
jgi:septal ring factor EnvC (AmiA/AmiB activator)